VPRYCLTIKHIDECNVNVYVSDTIITASASKSRLNTMKLCSPEKEFKGKYNECNKVSSPVGWNNSCPAVGNAVNEETVFLVANLIADSESVTPILYCV